MSSQNDIVLIRQYLRGELDERAMYALERRAQHDPELMDLMMGMELAEGRLHQDNLTEIDQLISMRTGGAKTRKIISWKILAAAASLFIVMGIAVFWMTRTQEMKPVLRPSVSAKVQPVLPPDSARNQQQLLTQIQPEKHLRELRRNRLAAKRRHSDTLSPKVVGIENKKDDSLYTAKTSLAEVAVVGYEAARKKAVTGSSQIILRGTDSLASALQGRLAGVRIESGHSDASVLMKGVVKDKQDSSPLSGAVIMIRGASSITTVTDVKGEFTLSVPSKLKNKNLVVSALGYDQEQIKFKGKDSLDVALNPSTSSLNEVVVVGYGAKRKTHSFEPLIGWTAYQKYLKDEAVLPDGQSGTVKLEFKLDAHGNPVHVRIKKGLSEKNNQKAVDILMKGSKWTTGSQDSTQVIRLKIKFQK
ncbi:carboxypeptidase-like regulatory domain-containing protein [Pedobacter nutrimenti]|uniref:carboxypeptidase-like regulatory domain-containing protein n=1 Tax=Pedobacter nutrimenti TaxID=1241337 RepID=UPI00292E23D9|nr:carboxypeptidase-like regulatory domain-containing protein [Pedobacter nutrimenti]